MRPGLPYLAVRCHGLNRYLLDPSTIKALAEAEDIGKLVDVLIKTVYRKDVGKMPMKEVNGFTLERIFNKKLIERCYFIADIASGGPLDFLRTYYRKFELQNIKRILRQKTLVAPAEKAEIESELLPIEQYSEVSFEALLRSENVEQAVELLGDTIYAPTAEDLDWYKEYKTLLPIETRLEKTYSYAVWEALNKLPYKDRKSVERVFGVMVDLENCLTILGSKVQEFDAPLVESLSLPTTYAIPKKTIDGMISAEDARSALSLLTPPYTEILEPILDGDAILAQARGFRHVLKQALREGRAGSVRFAYVLSYLISCEAENRDLVSIALGKQDNLAPEQIKKYLVSIPQRGSRN